MTENKHKITKEQIEEIIKGIKEMSKSKEQFLFMVFKNKNGTDNVTQYSYDFVPEKLVYYLQEAIKKGTTKESKK